MNSLKKYILSRTQKIVLLLFVIILIAAGYYAGFYLPVQRRIRRIWRHRSRWSR